GKGEIKIKLNIDGVAVSAAAKEKIMKAGGTIK
ncbi:uL15 family ribosomal protein, partial [Patescibacteria group bacterium]|nr:uL15 family ribosomal protein [Patescibacteria group bacterium]